MFRYLTPSEDVESVYNFDFDVLKEQEVKGLLFDIDNTLVPQDAPMDDRCREFLLHLMSEGFRVMIVSNNSEPRVKDFCTQVGAEYVFKAHKPKPDGFYEASRRMELNLDELRFFGDQLFTDIWGANRAGVYSVYVNPLDLSSDLPHITLKRWLEKPFLWYYFHVGKKRRKAR